MDVGLRERSGAIRISRRKVQEERKHNAVPAQGIVFMKWPNGHEEEGRKSGGRSRRKSMQAIVAVDSNWAIGNKGQLLVSIPADQKNFRNITMGKTIVYGRKTLETFPQQIVLPGRRNIILSTKPDYEVRNADVVHSREELLEAVKDTPSEDVFIIGGSSVYNEFLDDCDRCIVTFIDKVYEADSYFPNLDRLTEWELVSESDEQVYFDITYTYREYKRKK